MISCNKGSVHIEADETQALVELIFLTREVFRLFVPEDFDKLEISVKTQMKKKLTEAFLGYLSRGISMTFGDIEKFGMKMS